MSDHRRHSSRRGRGLPVLGGFDSFEVRFAVLRTPLLPLDALLHWRDADRMPDGPGVGEANAALDETGEASRLLEIFQREEMQEALFLAAPKFLARVQSQPKDGPQLERRLALSLLGYLARASGRPTPFGIFAGTSLARIGPDTKLELAPRAAYSRSVRVAHSYLATIARQLVSGRVAGLRCKTNPTLLQQGPYIRYVERTGTERKWRRHLVSRAGWGLIPLLEEARLVLPTDELIGRLAARGTPRRHARRLIRELLRDQVLVPEIPVLLVDGDPAASLGMWLNHQPSLVSVAGALQSTRARLARLRRRTGTVPPGAYLDAIRGLPGDETPSNVVQVDLMKPLTHSSVGDDVVRAALSGADLLRRIVPWRDELRPFREAFLARFGESEVPLLEALDESAGVGMTIARDLPADPLVADIVSAAPSQPRARWTLRDELLAKLVSTHVDGDDLLSLRDEDVAQLADSNAPPLPSTFAVIARLSQGADVSAPLVYVESVTGPSATRVLGRFGFSNPDLYQHLKRHVQAEEELDPDVLHAEILHLPQARTGNVAAHPPMRRFQIPILDASETPGIRTLPLSDLMVSVVGNRCLLRSATLQTVVNPRLANSHDFRREGGRTYRFLCLLQQQGVAARLSWQWGSLRNYPTLPRVQAGSVLIALRQWHWDARDLPACREAGSDGVARLAEKLRMPEHVVLQGDSPSLIDLSDRLAVESLCHILQTRDSATFTELFPNKGESPVFGPEGQFVHELILPFERTRPNGSSRRRPEPQDRGRSAAHPVATQIDTGSEWLSAHIECDGMAQETLLHEVLRPIADDLVGRGVCSRWHFLRIDVPRRHVRFRLNGRPEVWPDVLDRIARGLDSLGRNSRRDLRVEPYEPEVDRYGGPAGMRVAHWFFHVDSEATLDLFSFAPATDEGRKRRWVLALHSLEALIRDLMADANDGTDFLVNLRDAYHREFRGIRVRGLTGSLFRRYRIEILAVNDPAAKPVLVRRSFNLRPIVAEFRRLDSRGELSRPWSDIARSLVHIHVSRIVETALRENELVLYDFLVRRKLALEAGVVQTVSGSRRSRSKNETAKLTLSRLAD